MTAVWFGALAMTIALILESWCGAYGIMLPWSALMVFYLTVVYGWRVGTVVALIGGLVLDRIFLRSGNPSMAGELLAVGIGMLWLWRADSRVIWLRMLPGAGIAVTASWPGLIRSFWLDGPTPDMVLQGGLSGLFVLLASACLSLVLTLILDDLAMRLGLPRFEKARERFIHNRE